MAKTAMGGLSQHLRQLRKQRGWTLSQLSIRTGLATSTLSKVENGQSSLTYDNILKVANGFGIGISELFADQVAVTVKGRRSITRLGEEKTQDTENYEYKYHSTDLKNAQMVPIVVKVHARSIDEFGPLLQHSGEEFIFVISGAIEVHTEFYAPTRLAAGESIYLDSTMAHGYVSVGEGDATVLGVCSGATAGVWTLAEQ